MLRQGYLNLGRSLNFWYSSLLPNVLWRGTPPAHQTGRHSNTAGLPPSPPPSNTISKQRGIWSWFLIRWTGRRSNPKPPGIRVDSNRPRRPLWRLNSRCVFIALTDSVVLSFLSVSCYWNAKLVKENFAVNGFPCSNKGVESNQITASAASPLPLHLSVNVYVVVSMN